MKEVSAKIRAEGGKPTFLSLKGKKDFYDHLVKNEGKELNLTIGSSENQRTLRQNDSMHKYFELVSEELNKSGQTVRSIILLFKDGVDIPLTPQTTKEIIWRTIQRETLKKESTTELSTKEVSELYEVVNRFLAEKCGIHVPFPSEDLNVDNRS